jgi:D-alanine-D-alanine ligase
MTARSEKQRCDIAILVDAETGEPRSDGSFALDRGTMEAQVLQSLRAHFATVAVVPFDAGITPTIERLRALQPRLVFNLTEWLAGDRRLDAAIAGMLEMMRVRYTGAGPEGMQLARDKALAKQIVAALGVSVAEHALITGAERLPALPRYPAVLKPQFGDGSDEIGNSALVRTPRELERRVSAIRKRRSEPLMCEEFIAGRDLFVALLGNEPQVMVPLELVIGRRGAGAPQIATASVKNDATYRTRWRIRYREARLTPAVLARVNEASRRIFHALKLRDYARIDYRLKADGELVFLEANPNPDLARHTFGRNRCFAGLQHTDLIGQIVRSALARPPTTA